MVEPVTLDHGWWVITGPVHGRSCAACRRAAGGPDHQPDAPYQPPGRGHR